MIIPHSPVLLNEVVEVFSNLKNGYFIDCTLGYGGHSQAVLSKNPYINLIGFDRDLEAIEFSKKRLDKFKNRIQIFHNSFSQAISQVKDLEIEGILADIGLSSLQLDKDERGFSKNSNFLDMRMDTSQGISAFEVVNNYSKEELAFMFREYAEIPESTSIANKIYKARSLKPITSAKELSLIVGEKSRKDRKVSTATLVLQAIRIEVNDELGQLASLLKSIEKYVKTNCKIAIITFHSLEDRMVKRTFKEWSKNCICPIGVMKCICGNNNSLGKILTTKPIKPSATEEKENSRSRSSKMRVFQILGKKNVG